MVPLKNDAVFHSLVKLLILTCVVVTYVSISIFEYLQIHSYSLVYYRMEVKYLFIQCFQDCTVHLGCGGSQEADSHYKAVCRALVAEALELSTFLENVGTGQLSKESTDHLKLNEWVSTGT